MINREGFALPIMTPTLPPPAVAAETPSRQAVLERDLARLKQGSHYLKTALDQVCEGVLILMPEQEGREPYVMHANMRAHLMACVDPSSGLRERGLDELAADAEGAAVLRAALKQAREGGGWAECECALRAGLGGAARRHHWRVRAVTNEHGVLMNYTICLRAVEAAPGGEVVEEDQDALAARLRTENLAALAQGIAHDVNNLLGPVMVQLSMTLQRAEAQAELKAELEVMFAALKRARQFTQQVVKTVRTRAEERAPLNLGRLVTEALPVYTAGGNVEVRVNAAKDLMWVNGNAAQMSQVLQNLVMNGMQAMPCGGIMFVEMGNTEREAGNEEGLAPGRYVEVRVRDRGTGMAPEVLERVFKESFTTKADGSGIGLTTCRKFVLEHGGHIEVKSRLNVGTEFRLLLPAVPPQAHLEDTPGCEPIPLQPGEGRVLLVEDESSLRHVARCILTRCGYEVTEAETGEEALRIYKEESRNGRTPDVVMMDLTLPGGLTGGEAARAILAFDPAARLVVTSGSVTEDVQRAYLDEGFCGVLPKPYEAGALTMTVRAITQMAGAAGPGLAA